VQGGETIALTCSGIFDSNVKLGTLKIGDIERVVNLTYLDANTLTFVAPPIEWIKKTRYLDTSEDEDVEIQQPAEAEPSHVEQTEENKGEEEKIELSKEEKVEATVKKAKIEPVAEYAESMYKK